MDCGEMYNQRICKERLKFGSNTADIDLIPHIYIIGRFGGLDYILNGVI